LLGSNLRERVLAEERRLPIGLAILALALFVFTRVALVVWLEVHRTDALESPVVAVRQGGRRILGLAPAPELRQAHFSIVFLRRIHDKLRTVVETRRTLDSPVLCGHTLFDAVE
jgi:hypothetical protein